MIDDFKKVRNKTWRTGEWPSPWTQIQLNFNGSNSFGTMKIYSRQGKFELMSVNHSTRSGGIIEKSVRLSLT